MDKPSAYHIPALLEPTIEALSPTAGGVYADATFGGGGHSRAILSALGPEGLLFGFDQDLDAMENALPDGRFKFVRSNFRYMENFLRYYGHPRIDGVIADLGVSFHHFDDASRGFSFRTDSPLDMRMNQSADITAADIVNGYPRPELVRIFSLYTDLKRPGAFADAIISARQNKQIFSTGELAGALLRAVNPRQEKKDLAQAFQALRIEVNGEMQALEEFLLSTPRMLKQGGRLVILTYHSIEDRMVKNFFRAGNVAGNIEKDFYGKPLTPWRPLFRGAVTPTAGEIELNPRARSAKLRAAILI